MQTTPTGAPKVSRKNVYEILDSSVQVGLAANDRGAALVGHVGFGSGFWDVISPGKRPAGLRPFTAIDAGGRTAGTVNEHGLFFIAYTNNLDIPEKMLGTDGDGQHDHLMDFTQAVSGANFFAPALDVLVSLGA